MKKNTNLIWTFMFILTVSVCSSGLAQNQNPKTPTEELLNYYRLYKERIQNNNLQKKNAIGKESYNMPLGVNPYTSYFSDKGSAEQWSRYYYEIAQAKNKSTLSRKMNIATFNEKERPGENLNDTSDNSEFISNFGSGPDDTNTFLINGNLGPEEKPKTDLQIFETEEDNGSIPLANPIDLPEPITNYNTRARIGDGPQGSENGGNGDFDFYKVSLQEAELVQFSILATDSIPFNPAVLIYNEEGEILRFGFSLTRPQISLEFIPPVAGTYYFGVYDFETLFQTIPFQPFNSDSGGGVVLEGNYILQLGYFGKITDRDFYSFSLKKGDVFGVAIDGITRTNTNLFLTDDNLGAGTRNFTNFQTQGSPLPDNGETTLSYVIPEDGDYTLSIGTSVGPYTAEILATRSGLETNNKGKKQIVYLDYTGSEFNQRAFFNVPDTIGVNDDVINQERFLSPFEDFLENWGIENTTLNRVRLIHEIDKVVKEKLKQELREKGINPGLDILILSDLGSDFLGNTIPKILNKANIPFSKVIVGGTIEESGIRTIGIANEIDSGNFSIEDEALVLLDLLSNTDPEDPNSINNIPRADNVPIEELVAVVVGNVIAHEIGHYLGNYHTNAANDVFSIMDEGGNLNGIAGVAGEAAFGDESTVDVMFSKDAYSLAEAFLPGGSDQTDVNTAFALSFIPFGRKSSDDSTIKEILALENQVLNDLQEVVSTEILSYPNPQSTSGIASLQLGTEVYGATKVTILDIHGRTVQTVFDGVIKKGENKEIITDAQNLNLSRGVYTYAIKSNNKTFSHKFVVN
ncbi:pre-peptidase C-terminal domain-containing protein [Aquimarina sp. ERC-38]|uniref:pre-peptidase C-terminal domain-containing protein n=1 Tax=Aquimarina sp. ERC-38 TaxID=2949996 RepID=UPI0022465519|nr:pre-peptidase C-terminal domain-containing protein [Aquimarina sp. ERC-38]UZO82538.1 pre-peptidase C-terminal domain-containing protein [Aquimarina sp. ERC-38]